MAIMPTALQEMAFDCYLIFTCILGGFGTFVNKGISKGEECIEEVKIYCSHIYHLLYIL